MILTHVFDEAANALQIEAAGAGIARRVAGLTAVDVLAAGHELLDDPAYRSAATGLRGEMRALPTPAQIVADLANLV